MTAPGGLVLPALLGVRQCFSDSFMGRGITVKAGAPLVTGTRCIAAYVTDQGALVAACVADLALAASGGACLTMLAPNVAADAVRAGKPSDVILENWSEVMNILSSLFMVDGGLHIRFKKVHVTPPALPPDLAALVAKPGQRFDVDIGISGYPAGRLSMLLK